MNFEQARQLAEAHKASREVEALRELVNALLERVAALEARKPGRPRKHAS